jgi:hypothetical protein
MGATDPANEGNPVFDRTVTDSEVGDRPTAVLKLTPPEWRAVLEHRSFLERPDNRFQHPRRLFGAPVQIVPDDSFR